MAGFEEHIPPFPPEFGDDKGEFLRHYDRMQDKLDEEMVIRLNNNLDGLLVFAGLFIGINSAFLGFTLILVAPDPMEDISSLLQQLVAGLKSPTSLPSTSFSPSLQALIINALFTFSLSSAFFASFFAVLGKQWLTFYQKGKGGGLGRQRWEQLRRSLGAERWGLVPVLEFVLPVLIQTSLIIFAIGLVLFLQRMSETLAIFVLVPLLVGSLLSVLAMGFSIWDIWCPFRHPLAEILLKIPQILQNPLPRTRHFPWSRETRGKTSLFMKRTLRSLRGVGASRAVLNEGAARRQEDNGARSGFHNGRDEESGQARIITVTRGGPSASSFALSTVDQPRPDAERWRRLVHSVISKRGETMADSKTSLWGVWDSLLELLPEKVAKDDLVLQVESIKRVINVSEDPKALYHAALNLRAITDLELLQLVCDDESTTRGLRECYLEALKVLDKMRDPVKQHTELLRETLAFGTALFHASLSAPSFDDFITIIGMKSVTFPLDHWEMSPQAAQEAGDNCRRAQSFVRQFMNLQMLRLGPQPVALTSTTLAAAALWYAINGIPHSQDVVYGDQFREALGSGEVSWAGLGLLTLVSNNTCKFSDASQRRPYGIDDIDWCREAFLRVREAYHLGEPTQELADAIHDSLSTGNNLRSNAILFKFSWRLFTRDDDGDNIVEWGKRALSAGHHLVCALEKAIRSQKAIEFRETIKSREAIKSLEVISSAEASKATESSSAAEAICAQLIISAQAALSSAEAISAQKELSSAEAISVQQALTTLAAITAGGSWRASPGSREALGTEAAISALKALSAQKAAKKYEMAREMCFKAMVECMGPSDDQFRVMKRTSWRQGLTLKTATIYMRHIGTLGTPGDDSDNAFAKKVMEQIRHAQVNSLPAVLAMGRDYTDTKRDFEEAFLKLWPS